MRYGYLLPTRGVVMANEGAQTLAARVDSDVVGLARRAESAGFSSAWVGDSVLAKPRLDPFTTLAAVAAATESIDLGTAVHLPPLRNAVTLAHRMATVDQLSGGRLRFGVGVGGGEDVADEYRNVGVEYDRRGARLDETLAVLSALWEGEPVSFDGEFYDLDGASIGFSPAVTPPVYVGTTGYDPERGLPRPIRERLVEHGDGWFPTQLRPDEFAAGRERVEDLLSEAGRDPSNFGFACYLDVVVADDEASAIEESRRFHDDYYPTFPDRPDEWFAERGAYGTEAEVAETLSAYADAGVETLVVRFPTAGQREQFRRFGPLL